MGETQPLASALNAKIVLKLCVLSMLIGISQAVLANPPWGNPAFEEYDGMPEGKVSLYIDPDTERAILSIEEEWPPETEGNVPLLKLNFTKPAGEVDVELTSNPHPDNITLSKDVEGEWALILTASFDYEIIPAEFSVGLFADGQRQYLFIQIVDINDHAPEITRRDPSRVQPMEELKAPSDDVIIKFTAEDKDKNNKLTFSLEENEGESSYFRIDKDTGEVFQGKELNYTDHPSHRLDITVYDNGVPSRTAEDSVTISVKDVPNLPPAFTRPPIIPSLPEEMAVGSPVGLTVAARDGDTQLNWKMKYFIEDEFDFLQISEESGEVTIKNRIDAELKELRDRDLSYQVKITAQEIPGGNYTEPEESVSTMVDVTILDIDDEWPKFCEVDETPVKDSTKRKIAEECVAEKSFSFKIREDHVIGVITLDSDETIRVIDADYTSRNNTFDVNFAPGTAEFINKTFAISPRQGFGNETFTISVVDNKEIDFDDDTGRWRDDDGKPKPVTFKIEFKGSFNETKKAVATFQATVLDVNDNRPIFDLPDGKSQYEFSICENTADGEALYNIVPSERYPEACKESEKGDEIKVSATDKDISEEFGQNTIVYKWSTTGNLPPITLDEKTGKMTINKSIGNEFDYERRTMEYFTVQAFDKNGVEEALTDSAYVNFKILDRNDEKVDLRFGQGIRAEIDEATNMTEAVLDGITATDVDKTANITMRLRLSDGMDFPGEEELRSKVEKWFVLDVYEGSGTGSTKAKIMLGKELPDREGYGIMDIDRVDLTIEAEDLNSETGETQITSQDVTIIINDINDNIPEWPSEDENYTNRTFSVQETNEANDNETDTQREIQRFRVVDKDRGTRFKFYLENQLKEDAVKDCQLSPEICRYIREDMFELANINNISGTTVLSRRKGIPIDRENLTLFPSDVGDDRIFKLTFIASDGHFNLSAKINIEVTDINDNPPIFEEEYDSTNYSVSENVNSTVPGWNILTMLATDADHPGRFGKISYVIEPYPPAGKNDGFGNFDIGLTDGKLTARNNTYDWFDVQQYQVQVKAIDDYKEENPGQSNFAAMVLNIAIIDTNTYAPEFLTKEESGPLIRMGETEVAENEPFDEIIQIQDKDDPSTPNGNISVKITSVNKVPRKEGDPDLTLLFGLQLQEKVEEGNVRDVLVIPTRSFKGLWGNYTLELRASDREDSDPGPFFSEKNYTVEIVNENLNAPEFIVPADGNNITYRLSIQNSRPREQLVDVTDGENIPNVRAIDKDDGSGPNGQVRYEVEASDDSLEVCNGLFDIVEQGSEDSRTGMIVLTSALNPGNHTNVECTLNLTVYDKGEPPQNATNQLKFYLAWHLNSPPEFAAKSIIINMKENQTDGTPKEEVTYAIDPDIESGNKDFPNDTINYFFKGGDYDYFNLEWDDRIDNDTNKPRRIPILSPRRKLDYEEKQEFTLVLYATNNQDDPVDDVTPEEAAQLDKQWLVVTIQVIDIVDTAPIFNLTENERIVTAGFLESSPINNPIKVISVIDPDGDDPLSYSISEITSSDPILPTDPPPFEESSAAHPNDRSVGILLKFNPQPTYKGFYTFQLTATDSEGMKAEVSCRMYMVTWRNVVTFTFYNDINYMEQHKSELSEVLSDAFKDRCNIDKVYPGSLSRTFWTKQGSSMITEVEAHFVNLDNNELMNADVIVGQAYEPEVLGRLYANLTKYDFNLAEDEGIRGPQDPTSKNDPKDIIMYVLIGGVAILVVTLSILGATCYYNNRSLSRRVRALTATTFGSQQSDLNRIGNMNAPNTNSYAVEGSNPVWTVDADARRPHQFDTESIGSGGSVLIGAEDEDYFQKSSSNPMFQADDIVANYDSDDGMKNHFYNEPYNISSHGKGPAPQPPLGGKTPKNPLLNLGGGSRKSIDVDAISEDIDERDIYEEEIDNSFAFGKNDNFTLF